MNLKLKIRTDRARFDRKMRAVVARGLPEAREAIAIEAVGRVLKVIGGIAPRDTQRYANAYADAAIELGILGVFKVPLRDGKLAEVIRRRFAQRAEDDEWYYQSLLRRSPRNGRESAVLRRAREAAERSRRQLAEINETEGFLGFNVFGAGREGRSISVRTGVYGGSGRILRAPGRPDLTLVEVHNKEPHASIVEYRFKTMARARFAAGVDRPGTLVTLKPRVARILNRSIRTA